MNIEHINDVEKDEAQDGGPEGIFHSKNFCANVHTFHGI